MGKIKGVTCLYIKEIVTPQVAYGGWLYTLMPLCYMFPI